MSGLTVARPSLDLRVLNLSIMRAAASVLILKKQMYTALLCMNVTYQCCNSKVAQLCCFSVSCPDPR